MGDELAEAELHALSRDRAESLAVQRDVEPAVEAPVLPGIAELVGRDRYRG